MAKLDDYRRGIEFSTIQVELSHSDEVRQTWLRIRESYRHLLQIESDLATFRTGSRNTLRELDSDLNSLWFHKESAP